MIHDLKVYLVTAWNSTYQSFTFKIKRPILHLPSMTLFLEETNQSQYNTGKETSLNHSAMARGLSSQK